MDAGLCFLMISRNQAFYLPSGVWISIGTFVWEKGENILPLCWFAIVWVTFQASSERCKTRDPLASLLFLKSP